MCILLYHLYIAHVVYQMFFSQPKKISLCQVIPDINMESNPCWSWRWLKMSLILHCWHGIFSLKFIWQCGLFSSRAGWAKPKINNTWRKADFGKQMCQQPGIWGSFEAILHGKQHSISFRVIGDECQAQDNFLMLQNNIWQTINQP